MTSIHIDYDSIGVEHERLGNRLTKLEREATEICAGLPPEVMSLIVSIATTSDDEHQVYRELANAQEAIAKLMDVLPLMIAIRNKQQLTSQMLQRFSWVAGRMGNLDTETEELFQSLQSYLTESVDNTSDEEHDHDS